MPVPASRWCGDAPLGERRSNTIQAGYAGRLQLRDDWRQVNSPRDCTRGTRPVGDARPPVAHVATGWHLDSVPAAR
jgi:hypothetical protein